MKKISHKFIRQQIIFVLTFLFFAKLSAQVNAPKVTYTAGGTVDSELKSGDKIFHDPDGTIYIAGGSTDSKSKRDIEYNMEQNMIERISPDLKTASSNFISLNVPGEDKPQPAYYFAYLNSRLYGLADVDQNHETTTYSIEIDKSTLKTIGKPIAIFKSQDGGYHSSRIIASENCMRLMILQFEGPDVNAFTQIRIKVFQDDIGTSWEKIIPPPFSGRSFEMSDLKIFDDGTIVMVGDETYNIDLAKSASKAGKPDYMEDVITISESGATVTKRKLDLGVLFPGPAEVDILPDGKLVAAGFYSTEADGIQTWDPKFADGTFYAVFDKDMEIAKVLRTTEFNSDFIAAQMNDNYSKKIRIRELFPQKIFLRKDGSGTLVSEHIIPVGAKHFYEVVIIGFDANGYMNWTKRIFKSQEEVASASTDSRNALEELHAFSLYACVVNDQILIFFNDSKDNSATENQSKPETYKGEVDCNLICVSVGADGTISKQLVAEFDKTKTTPCISMFHQTGETDFICFGWGHNINDNVNAVHVGK